jgi:hypothetical protein
MLIVLQISTLHSAQKNKKIASCAGSVVSVVCGGRIHVIQAKFLVLLPTPLVLFNCNPQSSIFSI